MGTEKILILRPFLLFAKTFVGSLASEKSLYPISIKVFFTLFVFLILLFYVLC